MLTQDSIKRQRKPLVYDEVRELIYSCKSQVEMAEKLHCSKHKVSDFIRESGLYKEYCEAHNLPYNAEYANRVCSVCGDNTGLHRYKGVDYCKRHYLQMYRHGKILESTIYDKNDYEFDGDKVYIVLKDKNQNIKCKAIIDKDDYDKVGKYKWYEVDGYCVTKGIDKNNAIDIGNVIFDNYEVMYDHRDKNRLNNTKINLREVTAQQNAMNMGKKYNNTSGVTGVQLQTTKKKWTAVMTYKYETLWGGVHESFDEAVLSRAKMEVSHFHEYSPNYKEDTMLNTIIYVSWDDWKTKKLSLNLRGDIVENKILVDNSFDVKDIVYDDLVNYKEPSTFIGCCYCDWKCCKEQNIDISICQNNDLHNSPNHQVNIDTVIEQHIQDNLSKAIVFGGLEPMLQFEEIYNFIFRLRNKYKCNDPVIIYTGYCPEELSYQLSRMKILSNIVVKFGRFIPDRPKRYDDILGVTLISDNQYAERIS